GPAASSVTLEALREGRRRKASALMPEKLRMSKVHLFSGVLVLVVLCLVGFGGWIASLPAATADIEAPPVPQEEADAMLAALKPVKRERPLVAVIAINEATETTDYLVPT